MLLKLFFLLGLCWFLVFLFLEGSDTEEKDKKESKEAGRVRGWIRQDDDSEKQETSAVVQKKAESSIAWEMGKIIKNQIVPIGVHLRLETMKWRELETRDPMKTESGTGTELVRTVELSMTLHETLIARSGLGSSIKSASWPGRACKHNTNRIESSPTRKAGSSVCLKR